MRVGIHYIAWRKDLETTHNPDIQGGYWVVYPRRGDPNYKGTQPEQALYEPLCFTDLLRRLFADEKQGIKHRLTAYWRKTRRRNIKHEWKTQLWRDDKGLVYGRIDQFGNKRIDYTSYARPHPYRKYDWAPKMTEPINEEELFALYERCEGKCIRC